VLTSKKVQKKGAVQRLEKEGKGVGLKVPKGSRGGRKEQEAPTSCPGRAKRKRQGRIRKKINQRARNTKSKSELPQGGEPENEEPKDDSLARGGQKRGDSTKSVKEGESNGMFPKELENKRGRWSRGQDYEPKFRN